MKPWTITIIRYASDRHVRATLHRPAWYGRHHVRTSDIRGGLQPAVDAVLELEEEIPAGTRYEISDPMNPDPGRWINWAPGIATEVDWS